MSEKWSRYPRLVTPLSPHLHARIHAASTVLKRPVEELVEQAVQSHLAGLAEEKRELIDRVAASLLHSTEMETPPPDGSE